MVKENDKNVKIEWFGVGEFNTQERIKRAGWAVGRPSAR